MTKKRTTIGAAAYLAQMANASKYMTEVRTKLVADGFVTVDGETFMKEAGTVTGRYDASGRAPIEEREKPLRVWVDEAETLPEPPLGFDYGNEADRWRYFVTNGMAADYGPIEKRVLAHYAHTNEPGKLTRKQRRLAAQFARVRPRK